MLGADIRGELRFELSAFRAQHVLAMLKHFLDTRINAGLNAAVLTFEIDKIHELQPYATNAVDQEVYRD